MQQSLMRGNYMNEPRLYASSSQLPRLRLDRCKVQAQCLSIAGSWLSASKLFTILKIEARSQNIKITSLMHKGMQVHGALNPKGQ